MKEFFDYLNEIDTVLDPISKETWMKKHQWVYDSLSDIIEDDHIVDVGCGCGLLASYLVWKGVVKTAEMYDIREPQITYAENLVNHLGLQNQIRVIRKFIEPNDLVNKTIVSTRFGSMFHFEKLIYKNKLITLRRTEEVEPLFIRKQILPWDIKIISRDDNFQLELLTTSYDKFMDIIDGGRWVEDLSPELEELISAAKMSLVEKSQIGDDYMER